MIWNVFSAFWLVLSLFVEGVQCVYFTQSDYLFHFGDPFVLVGKVTALANNTNNASCGPQFFQYNVSTRDGDDSTLFTINGTGFIFFKGNTINLKTGDKIDLTVNVLCKRGRDIEKGEVASAFVTVLYRRGACTLQDRTSTNHTLLSGLTDRLCFQSGTLQYTVEENNDLVPIGFLGGCPFVNISSFAVRRFSEYNATLFDIVDISSEIVLKRQLDRESDATILISRVVCRVIYPEINVTHERDANLTIHIGDANDSPIRFQVDGDRVVSGANGLVANATEQVVSLVAIDDDVRRSTPRQYQFEVHSNPDRACSSIYKLECHIVPQGHSIYTYAHTACRLLTNVTKPPAGSKADYTCTISLTDTGNFGLNSKLGNKTSFLKIVIPPDAEPQTTKFPPLLRKVSVSISATKYSRIFDASTLMGQTDSKQTLYHIHSDPSGAFMVTFLSGVVYIDKLDLYRRITSRTNLTIITRYPSREVVLTIVVQRFPSPRAEACDESCSRYYSQSACAASCAVGASFGMCMWRHGDNRSMSRNYSTCTPEPDSCPDGVCDELEAKHPEICPQDCTRAVVKGEGELHKTGVGIYRGTSPCWCDYNNECTCFRSLSTNSEKKFNVVRQTRNQTRHIQMSSSYSVNPAEVDSNITNKKDYSEVEPKSGAQTADTGICDWDCRTTIAATGGCVGALLCIVVLTWRLRKYRCRSGHAIKHVGSTPSMSGVPSDYMDDRDYRTTSHSSPQWSPKRSMDFLLTIDDNKWEVRRENLALDKTLGEGEFGRVVKGIVRNMDGKDGYKEVAVKMLKNCASSGELQDLLSEYNLLKDVNHPNVIRLLGACTRDGPFYVIVEYCEHGSLLHYLRRSRLEENGYVNYRYRRYIRRKSTEDDGTEMDILNIRDLLSFAWQIAKGMRYLSEIKLVHRDLAARNVLVGAGKVLKISDFGLTRDVYTSATCTYLKRSKGRIPVKWMAPESLYAQIYTTQSDVWSFGIVLWEIVTLGAPPYPGIPPERLYNLLIAGYRMDRPEGCSDELYAVMQKCWKTDPVDRPNFANLADIFDKMLQQRTEYLELTGGFEDNSSDLFDRPYGEHTTFSQNLEEDGHYNSVSSSTGTPYLTPASPVPGPEVFKTKDDRGKSVQTRNKKNNIKLDPDKDFENVALLLNTRSVVYSNSSESDEELSSGRQTGILQTTA